MSRTTSATLNYQLTNFAQGFMNDASAALELAERLAPTVTVPGGSGQYKTFHDLNSFQIYATTRALGGDANRIEFATDDAFYNTKPQALEVTVDQQEREQAGNEALAQQLLDQGKIKALLNSTMLAHVKKVTDYVIDNTTAESGIGEWSNPDIDPIEQLDQVFDDLATQTGGMLNLKLTMSLTSWRAIRNHPKVKARVNATQVIPLTREQLVSCLAVPVDLGVYAISYNTAKLGQSVTKARLVSNQVFCHASVASPTVYDPSPFKVFTMNRSRVTGVRTYQDQSGRYDVHAVDWSEDIKETSSVSMKRLAIT
jgi:hypothetical protein